MVQAKAQLASIQERTQQLIREISFSKQQDLLAAKAQEDMLREELDRKNQISNHWVRKRLAMSN